ncbi:hypothetical protein PINS_up007561 [Pythium insidiosum]|nr:hypothetical protein PINS_up007561 [Pythium insidiosum]
MATPACASMVPNAPTMATISPSRKRPRPSMTSRRLPPLARRLRARIDRSERVWAGRCGCQGPGPCMAESFQFSDTDDDASIESDSVWESEADDAPAGDQDQSLSKRPTSGRSPREDSTIRMDAAAAAREEKGEEVEEEEEMPMLLHYLLMI